MNVTKSLSLGNLNSCEEMNDNKQIHLYQMVLSAVENNKGTRESSGDCLQGGQVRLRMRGPEGWRTRSQDV